MSDELYDSNTGEDIFNAFIRVKQIAKDSEYKTSDLLFNGITIHVYEDSCILDIIEKYFMQKTINENEL